MLCRATGATSPLITMENIIDDRELHMSPLTAGYMARIRSWAHDNGHSEQLEEALNYLRTYPSGPEANWKTIISHDVPYDQNCKNLIAYVYRRTVPSSDNDLSLYMVIGMIWHESSKSWGLHT